MLTQMHSLPCYRYDIPQESGIFITIDALILTHHNHPRPTVCIRVHAWIVHSVGLDKCK